MINFHCDEGKSFHINVNIMEIQNYLSDEDRDFQAYVLNGMRTDNVGNYIVGDATLLCYGRYLFRSKRRDSSKLVEEVKTVRSQLRQLTRLYLEFLLQKPKNEKLKSILDMFDHRNFQSLMQAVNKLSKDNGKLKHGLKLGLYYAILACAKFYHAFFIQEEDAEKSSRFEHFIKVLKMNEPISFSDARTQINFQRQRISRKPAGLPLEEDLEILRKFLLSEIKRISEIKPSKIKKHDYITLRNITCSRLTLGLQ